MHQATVRHALAVMFLPASLLLARAGACAAQDPLVGPPLPPPAGAPAATAQDPRLYDFVAAMVGNKAMLASQVTEIWREEMQIDAQRPPALRQYVSASKRHARWAQILEILVSRETAAQSARLLGRSPEEVEAQVQRLVEEDIAREAESAGGLAAFSRKLDGIGRSMGSRVEESRADIMRQMAYFQGVLRELHEQRAMLATPKEMKAAFDANPGRFVKPGGVRLAVQRFAKREHGSARARELAAAAAATWRALATPPDEAALRAPNTHFLNVSLEQAEQDANPVFRSFTPLCKTGEVSPPTDDDEWVWVMLCLSRTETTRAGFDDPEVQTKLRDEIANRHWEQVATRLFPESRVGVRRLPWGEPATMERPRRGAPGR